MFLDNLYCPVCKESLVMESNELHCTSCTREFLIVDGIPDLFISKNEKDSIDDPSKTWMDSKIVDARDSVYRLCVRELKGMAFCMQEIRQRTSTGCRILEVGMGTGHFTRWLAEVSRPGTEIYAFDFSWPIIEKAKANTQGLSDVILFRANARGQLPFKNESFDIVLLRLAPLGAHGVPNVRAGYELLKSGGWYFEAGWEKVRYEIPATEWAMRHGFESAQHHEWQYWRTQTKQEQTAAQIELAHFAARGGPTMKRTQQQTRETDGAPREEGALQKMTYENLLIAQR